MTVPEKIKMIAEYFGASRQYVKLIEELAELTQALTKFIIYGEQDHLLAADVCSEIADVEILLEQIKGFLDQDPFIAREKVKKINRTIERIKSGVY